jgi:general secretion pathway protein G
MIVGAVGSVGALLLVLMIIGLRPTSFPPISNSDEREAQVVIENLGIAVELYRIEYEKLLPEELGLEHLSDPRVELIRQVPADPWGEPYEYSQLTNDSFIIWSGGSKNNTGGTFYRVFDLPLASESRNSS